MIITNYIFLYGYRILLAYLDKKNMKLKFINNVSKSEFLQTQTKNEYYINNSSTIGGNNNCYTISDNNNNINTEQMIVTSPPKIFTKMYNHDLREANYNNLNRSF